MVLTPETLKLSSFKRHFALKLDEKGLKNYPILAVNLNPFFQKSYPKELNHCPVSSFLNTLRQNN